MDSSKAARYQLATEYMRGAQFNRAIPLLEDLYQEQPETIVFFKRLKEAYENVKRYDDTIRLIDEALERDSQDALTLTVDKARLYYLAGKDEHASSLWETVLDYSQGSESIYRLVYNSLLEVRLLDRAINVLLRGRADNEHSILFQPELAHLYSLTGQHEKAMEEYLGLLALNKRQINYVRGRLSRSIKQEGALDASLRMTSRYVASNPEDSTARDLLSWLYIEAGDYAAAFTHVMALDDLNGENGLAIYQFARRAAEGGAFNIARKAYESVLAAHPDTPVAAEAYLGMADMNRLEGEAAREDSADPGGAPHYEAALKAYQSFLITYPDHVQVPEVMTRIGALQQHVFYNLDAARQILTQVVNQYTHTQIARQAHLDLGRLALERGELDEAEPIFIQLANESPVGEFTVQAQLELALIHFYKGDFDLAAPILAMLSQDTHTEVANDAITLRVLLLENPAQDSSNTVLGAYAHVALLLRQRKEHEVLIKTAELLAEWGQHSIADEVRYLRAQAFRQSHQIHEALAAFGELPLIHPTSPYRDRSLFNYAEILEYELGEMSAALDAYTDLLTRFPGSLLVNEARARIRTLRETGI